MAKKHNACNRCLQPGHSVKACELEHLKCCNCEGTGHATLLCHKGDNKGKEKAKPPDTSTHHTVTAKDEDHEPVENHPAVPETT